MPCSRPIYHLDYDSSLSFLMINLHKTSSPFSCSTFFQRLFKGSSPGKNHEDGDFLRDLNPESLITLRDAYVEPSLANCRPGETFQFERLGYFCLDSVSNSKGVEGPLLFNRVVTLKDNWAAPSGELSVVIILYLSLIHLYGCCDLVWYHVTLCNTILCHAKCCVCLSRSLSTLTTTSMI